MRLIVILNLLLLCYVLTITAINQVYFNNSGTIAPLYVLGDTAIKDAYIVVLKKEITENQMINHLSRINAFISHYYRTNSKNKSLHDQGIRHLYDTSSLKGYSGRFDQSILSVIRESVEVSYVEEDSVVHTTELQRNSPWGLARISSRKSLNFFTFDKYHYNSELTGKGIKVYIVDTGINLDHVDFEGRAIWGTTVPSNERDIDGNGHGTHCAGIIAGKIFGVAKKVHPVAVKVLRANGSGAMSDVVKGVEWLIHDYLNDERLAKAQNKKFKGAVASMSLGGRKSPTLNSAVDEAVDRGIVFSVAAGNAKQDACFSSPSSSEKAITVGATDIKDKKASFSNFGRCVDLFAPGVGIKSAWTGHPRAAKVLSGTSMASPHVAGLAAYFLSKGRQAPKEIKNQIIRLATGDSLSLIPDDTPNLLAFNGYPFI